MKLQRPRATTIMFSLLLIVAIGIFGLLVVLSIEENRLRHEPVDVLENWSLKVDGSRPYKPGETVTVDSKFDKILSITGNSNRFVQCLRPQYFPTVEAELALNPNYDIPSKYWDGYVLSNTIKANQPKTNDGGTQFVIGIPLSIVNLPNYCRVYVSITYNVNKYHPAFQENNYSNIFRVEPRDTLIQQGSETFIFTDEVDQDNPQAYSIPSPSNPEQPIIIYRTEPSETVPENAPPTTLQPQSGPLRGLVNGVTGLVDDLTNRLRF